MTDQDEFYEYCQYCDSQLDEDGSCAKCQAAFAEEAAYYGKLFKAGLLDPPATQAEWAAWRRLKRDF